MTEAAKLTPNRSSPLTAPLICKIKMAKTAPPEGAVSEPENAFRLAGRSGREARRFLFRTVSGGFLTAFLALRLLVLQLSACLLIGVAAPCLSAPYSSQVARRH